MLPYARAGLSSTASGLASLNAYILNWARPHVANLANLGTFAFGPLGQLLGSILSHTVLIRTAGKALAPLFTELTKATEKLVAAVELRVAGAFAQWEPSLNLAVRWCNWAFDPAGRFRVDAWMSSVVEYIEIPRGAPQQLDLGRERGHGARASQPALPRAARRRRRRGLPTAARSPCRRFNGPCNASPAASQRDVHPRGPGPPLEPSFAIGVPKIAQLVLEAVGAVLPPQAVRSWIGQAAESAVPVRRGRAPHQVRASGLPHAAREGVGSPRLISPVLAELLPPA
jgi:hypothetical protein